MEKGWFASVIIAGAVVIAGGIGIAMPPGAITCDGVIINVSPFTTTGLGLLAGTKL